MLHLALKESIKEEILTLQKNSPIPHPYSSYFYVQFYCKCSSEAFEGLRYPFHIGLVLFSYHPQQILKRVSNLEELLIDIGEHLQIKEESTDLSWWGVLPQLLSNEIPVVSNTQKLSDEQACRFKEVKLKLLLVCPWWCNSWMKMERGWYSQTGFRIGMNRNFVCLWRRHNCNWSLPFCAYLLIYEINYRGFKQFKFTCNNFYISNN